MVKCIYFHSISSQYTMTSRYWDSMGNLVKSLVNSIASIAALLVLLMLSIFIAALLGMQIFGGKFDPDSRSNFNGIVPSTVTVFQVPLSLGISEEAHLWKMQFFKIVSGMRVGCEH